VARIGVESLLGRSVADFGAGAGLFLAAVGGVASRTIAIEPNGAFRARLESEGHETFTTARDIPDSLRVDVAVSFDTIEHVDDPLGFVRAMADRLAPGGTLYLSMPNRDDILRRCFPEAFEPFMYQTAHTLYFDARSAAALMERSGLAWYRVGHLHKYGFDNLVRWARRHAPGREPGLDIFDDAFAASWRGHMERLGLASHLFITGRKS
jgi:SAM-dependent methyltransferase